jgi:hypothetical protein
VESGTFVGWMGNREYVLGSTEVGLARAIRRMNELRREIEADDYIRIFGVLDAAL